MIKGEIVEELKRIVGEEDVLTEKEDLASYAYDGTTNWYHEPDVVVFPTSAEEVSEILKLANRERIPVTPRGGGTSVSGGPVPIYGGIVLCTVKMNRILKIDKENLLAVAEPGVVLMDFNLALAKEGLFFPPDPQSFLGATLGGNVAENAGGPACVKYGVVKQYVLGLEAVLPTGEIVEFGGMTVKNVTGYDLPMLLTGSEGTLGVITKITLKVLPLPPATKTLMAVFDDVAVAGGTVYQVLSGGVIPSKIELLDNWVINSIERLQPMGLPKDAGAALRGGWHPGGRREGGRGDREDLPGAGGPRGEGRQGRRGGQPLLDGAPGGFCSGLQRSPDGAGRGRHRPQEQDPRFPEEDGGDLQAARDRVHGDRPCR